MACLSVNRMDPVKKMEKVLVTKKQQSMSNYRFIVISSRAPVSSLFSERLQSDCRQCRSVLGAVQDMVATLFDIHERVVSSSYHAVPRGRLVD